MQQTQRLADQHAGRPLDFSGAGYSLGIGVGKEAGRRTAQQGGGVFASNEVVNRTVNPGPVVDGHLSSGVIHLLKFHNRPRRFKVR